MNHTTTRSPGRRLIVTAVITAVIAVVAFVVALLSLVPAAVSASFGFDEADGIVPEGVTLTVDSGLPAVERLDGELREAVREASVAARAEGIEIDLTSGWRSERYQAQLFDEAVDQYGSEEAAREFVAPPTGSHHVTGDAVDVGGLEAQLWLMEHGYRFGLCQTYSNERWHFELATVPGGACPEMLLDAREDWS